MFVKRNIKLYEGIVKLYEGIVVNENAYKAATRKLCRRIFGGQKHGYTLLIFSNCY